MNKDIFHKVLIENKIKVEEIVYNEDSPKEGDKKIRDILVLSYSGRLSDKELEALKELFRADYLEIGSDHLYVDCPEEFYEKVRIR